MSLTRTQIKRRQTQTKQSAFQKRRRKCLPVLLIETPCKMINVDSDVEQIIIYARPEKNKSRLFKKSWQKKNKKDVDQDQAHISFIATKSTQTNKTIVKPSMSKIIQ